MTVSTTSSSTTILGNGSTTVFNFSFIGVSADDIVVYYTPSGGPQTTLPPSQYTLSLNAPTAGQVWGGGGTVTYPLSGSPISSGSSLTITRIVPYTQETTISNQGPFSPIVIEEALDTLEFQIQQLISRTGQLRGTWVSGTVYNFGDVVIDGANGAGTGNYYMCTIANTAGTWATDLAAGDWSLAIDVAAFTTVAGGSSGQIQYNNGGFLGGFTSVGDVTYNTSTGTATITAGAVTGAKIATNTVANSNLVQMTANTIKGNNTVSTANASDISQAAMKTFVGAYSYALSAFTSSGTFTVSADSTSATIYHYTIVAGGGGGGGSNGSAAAGGGGGAGELAQGTFTGVTASSAITITIGAAGTAGANTGGTGGTGGTSSIGSPVSITCVGGTGGTGTTSGSASGGAGGTGGTGSATLRVAGGRGQNGNGVSTVLMGGNGATTIFGGGGTGGTSGNGALGTPTGYGAGGGAGAAVTAAGTTGAAGVVIIQRLTP